MAWSRRGKTAGIGPLLTGVVFLLLMTLQPVRLHAQDGPFFPPLPDRPLTPRDTLLLHSQRTDTVPLLRFLLPATFTEVGDNQLQDADGVLDSFWEKLRLLRATGDSLHILHVGDSHVRGHIFPQTVGDSLKQAFTTLRYTDMGINGAFCTTFTRPDRVEAVVAQHPDLLILSFGTNESHNRRYNATLHRQQLDNLVRALRDSLPDVPILLTTPPGSYERFGRRRNRSYKINPRTAATVQTIREYAVSNGLALWDMYGLLGGSSRACRNWWESGLMRPDHVHYLPEGYTLQGRLLYQAILKSYNDYVR